MGDKNVFALKKHISDVVEAPIKRGEVKIYLALLLEFPHSQISSFSRGIPSRRRFR